MMVPTLPPVPYVQRYESRATGHAGHATFQRYRFALPELARVADIDAAPWLPDALEELRALKSAGVNMPGVGDFTISGDTVDRARQILASVCITRLPAPTIVPFSGGGLALSWSRNNRELTLSVYPDQEVTYERTNADHLVVEDDALTSDDDLIGIIRRFVVSLAE